MLVLGRFFSIAGWIDGLMLVLLRTEGRRGMHVITRKWLLFPPCMRVSYLCQRQILKYKGKYTIHTQLMHTNHPTTPPLCPFDLLRQNNTFVAKICRFRRKNHRRYHARLPANDLLCLLSGEGGDPTSIQFLQLSLGPQGPHGIPFVS